MASIAFCASLCRPSREIVKAGNATTLSALLMRSAMIALAFCSAASFDRGGVSLISTGTTGDSA
jgi:hypothetical protein